MLQNFLELNCAKFHSVFVLGVCKVGFGLEVRISEQFRVENIGPDNRPIFFGLVGFGLSSGSGWSGSGRVGPNCFFFNFQICFFLFSSHSISFCIILIHYKFKNNT